MASTNILFDYLLIFGKGGFPEMGVAGAGLASVIAEATSALFLIIYALKFVDLEKYGFKRISFKGFEVIKKILNISISLKTYTCWEKSKKFGPIPFSTTVRKMPARYTETSKS